WPRPGDDEPARAEPEDEPSTDRLAPVIPLGVFDAQQEARKWW
ncbi:MAG: hypothetical protein QOJ68_2103, partial [Blastococcus sp.]|nr:hypothetical protein [Blastococcus sp.]